MSFKSNLLKAAAIGGAVTLLSSGAAFAAFATANVHVRTGPSTSYRSVDVLRPGEYVSINDRSRGWCRVSRPGPNGWVSCAYLAGDRVNVYPRDDFPRRVYPRYREPEIGFSFGFGYPYPRVHVRPSRPWWW